MLLLCIFDTQQNKALPAFRPRSTLLPQSYRLRDKDLGRAAAHD